MGDDFCVFNGYSNGSEIMTMYFYNSETNNWTIIELPKQISSDLYSSNEHVYACTSNSPNRETIFYSSFLDTYAECQFPVNISVWQRIGYALTWASSSEKSYFFDGQTGALYEFDFEFAQNGLGDFAASFYDFDTKTLYGYSALSGQWTNLTIVDTPYTCVTEGFVGLVSSNTHSTYYSKYYAFNGLEDSWVQLVPAGSYVEDRVGQKIALVIRSNMIYAFGPNGRLGTYMYWIEFEGNFFPISLFTNSTISNFSFNQSLKEIRFNVTGSDGTVGFCNLTLTNTLVQNLWQSTFTVLVDGEQPTQTSSWTDVPYTYLYFTYIHSEHQVVIIQEFSSLIILPLFMVVTLLAIIFGKRKHSGSNVRHELVRFQHLREERKLVSRKLPSNENNSPSSEELPEPLVK
jgi:hypothetical protein